MESKVMMFSCDHCSWEFDVTYEEYKPMLACQTHPCCDRCQIKCACGKSSHGKKCTVDCWNGLKCHKCEIPITSCCIEEMLDSISNNSEYTSNVHRIMAGCWECDKCHKQ